MSSPYPAPIAGLLKLAGESNRSLLFDRGMDRYGTDDRTGRPKIAKEEFLQDFSRFAASSDRGGLAAFLQRRAETLTFLGAQVCEIFTATRLVIGLGLPSPIETGFLLDRLSGCPYLPGSSVKGLLRAAARLVETEELEGNRDFWHGGTIRRVFGPEIGGGFDPRKGSLIFYDAFPSAWPKLAVDVLTPHYGKYYRGDGPPADWSQPIPIPFLAVEPGECFRFPVASREKEVGGEDLAQIEALLKTALESLGIGAKKAVGYGYFTSEKPQPAVVPREGQPTAQPPPSPLPAAQAKEVEILWQKAELGWHLGSPAAFQGKRMALCARDLLAPDLRDALKKKTKLWADVAVVKLDGGDFRVVAVKSWKKA
jgi:CRISPR-associated protein Cmr6